MERQHPLGDTGPAEELAPVVEDHFVVVAVAVEERQAQRRRIGLERARCEQRDDEPAALQDGVRGRW